MQISIYLSTESNQQLRAVSSHDVHKDHEDSVMNKYRLTCRRLDNKRMPSTSNLSP